MKPSFRIGDSKENVSSLSDRVSNVEKQASAFAAAAALKVEIMHAAEGVRGLEQTAAELLARMNALEPSLDGIYQSRIWRLLIVLGGTVVRIAPPFGRVRK